MLSDNLDFQESIIHDIKDRAKIVLGLFPAADGNKARVKLIALDQRFLLVKERLQRRQEEMLKASVDWHEFECGLKSCLEWVQRAEERLSRDVPENEVNSSWLKVWEPSFCAENYVFYYTDIYLSFFTYFLGTIFTLNLLLTAWYLFNLLSTQTEHFHRLSPSCCENFGNAVYRTR